MPHNSNINISTNDLCGSVELKDMSREQRDKVFGRPLVYRPAIAKAVGSVKAGILVSQLLYWTPKAAKHDGWIYKSQKELYEETGLSRCEQETARDKLKQAGLLDEVRKGIPARLHYKVNMARLCGLLAAKRVVSK